MASRTKGERPDAHTLNHLRKLLVETRAIQELTGGSRLSDPEFFAYWAAARNSLAYALGNSDVKRRYDIAKAEFRRRIEGGLAASADN